MQATAAEVLRLKDVELRPLAQLFARYGLQLVMLPAGVPIPGSYWGESEAGLRGERLLVRPDTPVHSVLHEGSHFVCMNPPRRAALDRDAGGDELKKPRCATCRYCWRRSCRVSAAHGSCTTWTPGATASGSAVPRRGTRAMRTTRASGCSARALSMQQAR